MQIFTVRDVVPEELAVPPGASVRDLRTGAWVDERRCLVVRNFGQPGDACELCGNDQAEELKREFRTYQMGTVGDLEHPDGHCAIECFDMGD